MTPNGGGAGGVPPGSAPERNAPGSPRASRPALRGFFAPGTPASAPAAPGGSGGHAADVDELAATLGRPRRDAGGVAVGVAAAAAAPAAGLETEASSRPGTAARSARVVGGRWRNAHPTGLKPTRASLDVEPDAIPDAISQLEQLERTLLTRRDIEHLFGVSKVRAAALMKTFGAEMTGNQRTLPRTKLL